MRYKHELHLNYTPRICSYGHIDRGEIRGYNTRSYSCRMGSTHLLFERNSCVHKDSALGRRRIPCIFRHLSHYRFVYVISWPYSSQGRFLASGRNENGICEVLLAWAGDACWGKVQSKMLFHLEKSVWCEGPKTRTVFAEPRNMSTKNWQKVGTTEPRSKRQRCAWNALSGRDANCPPLYQRSGNRVNGGAGSGF